MYESVRVYPDGDATAARSARTAARYGYDGVVVRERRVAPDYDAVRAGSAVDVVDAVEIVADGPPSASGAVGNYRPKRTLVLVRGGTEALNRFAVEQDRVDVLATPFRGDGDVNHVLAKAAREHGVRIEFDLGPVVRESGGRRVQQLRKLRKLAELVDHYDAPFVVSGTPASHLQLRAPRELRALGEVVGLGGDRIRDGLREWGRIAARNRERQSDAFVAPGVRTGRYAAGEEAERSGARAEGADEHRSDE